MNVQSVVEYAFPGYSYVSWKVSVGRGTPNLRVIMRDYANPHLTVDGVVKNHTPGKILVPDEHLQFTLDTHAVLADKTKTLRVRQPSYKPKMQS